VISEERREESEERRAKRRRLEIGDWGRAKSEEKEIGD
jgi:hypothetical protein